MPFKKKSLKKWLSYTFFINYKEFTKNHWKKSIVVVILLQRASVQIHWYQE